MEDSLYSESRSHVDKSIMDDDRSTGTNISEAIFPALGDSPQHTASDTYDETYYSSQPLTDRYLSARGENESNEYDNYINSINLVEYRIGDANTRVQREKPNDKEMWQYNPHTDKSFSMFLSQVVREPKLKTTKPFLTVSSNMKYSTLESRKTVSTTSGKLIKLDKNFIESNANIIARELSNPVSVVVDRGRSKTPQRPHNVDLQKLTLNESAINDEISLPDKYANKVPEYYAMPSKIVANLADIKRKSINSLSVLSAPQTQTGNFYQSIDSQSVSESQRNESIMFGDPAALSLEFTSKTSHNNAINPMDDVDCQGLSGKKHLEGVNTSRGKSRGEVKRGPILPLKVAQVAGAVPSDKSQSLAKSSAPSRKSLGFKGGKLSAVMMDNPINSSSLYMENLELIRKINSLQNSYSQNKTVSSGASSPSSQFPSLPGLNAGSKLNVKANFHPGIVWDTSSQSSGDQSEISSLQRGLQNMLRDLGNVESHTIDPSICLDVNADGPINTGDAALNDQEVGITTTLSSHYAQADLNDEVGPLSREAHMGGGESSMDLLSSSNQASIESMGDSESTSQNPLLKKKLSKLSLGIASMPLKASKFHSHLDNAPLILPPTSQMYSLDPDYVDPGEPAGQDLRYQVHQRIMGWKMTNFKRRKDLISLLDMTHINQTGRVNVLEKLAHPSSTGSMHIDDDDAADDNSSLRSIPSRLQIDRASLEESKERPVSSEYRLLGHKLISEGVVPLSAFDSKAVSYFKPDELIKGAGAKLASESHKDLITKSMIEILSKNALSPESKMRQITSWGGTVGRLALARDRSPAQRAKNAFANRHKNAEKEEDWTAKLRYQDRNDIMQNYSSFKTSGFYSGKGAMQSTTNMLYDRNNYDDKSLLERHLKWYGEANLSHSGDDLQTKLGDLDYVPKDVSDMIRSFDDMKFDGMKGDEMMISDDS